LYPYETKVESVGAGFGLEGDSDNILDMSKIDAGKNAGETLQSLKDLYADRERDSESKHRTELSQIQKAHATEIESVRSEANARVKTAQESTSAKISEREMQFQKEIEAMRAMYQKRAGDSKKSEAES
jgi:hypothetical protein